MLELSPKGCSTLRNRHGNLFYTFIPSHTRPRNGHECVFPQFSTDCTSLAELTANIQENFTDMATDRRFQIM